MTDIITPGGLTQPSLNLVTPVTFRSTAAEPVGEASMMATSPSFITNSGEPNEEEFAFIRENFGDPRAKASPSDYYAFRMIASGDGLDSYFTRQDVETSFRNFVRDLKKGQSVLGSHLMATFPYGSSYDAEVIPADPTRAEYEGTFYPQWDTPDLRTANWLVGKYFIPRNVSVNGQSSNDLIRSLELGSIRKASISFMVGQYVCGIDGHDLVSTMFGPMPDEACQHFPGVAYEGQIAWALMKNNTLVETSLVYKNASPSSMLLRKAEALASRGVLDNKQIDQIESRYQVRLPRFQRQVWTNGNVVTGPTVTLNGTVPTLTDSSSISTTYVMTTTGTEEDNMAGRRKGGDATARDLAREALTAEAEPEQSESAETESDEVDDAVADAPEATPETTPDAPDAGDADDAAPAPSDAPADVAEAQSEAPAEPVSEAAEPDTTSDVSAPEAEPEAVDEAEPVAEAEAAEEHKEEPEPKSESTREEDAVESFTAAADRLASALARNPDAFDSGQLSVAARAERAVDLALIDAGCDTTVGGHVARVFEMRSKSLREALGEQLTVEAIRGLQAKATLGETLYEELVKDAVAARVGAQGDSFNAPKYRDLLMAARDVAYVKEEIDSWKEAKKDRYTPGRSVVPRQIADARPSKEDRKSLPEAPTALTAPKAAGSAGSLNILGPRK